MKRWTFAAAAAGLLAGACLLTSGCGTMMSSDKPGTPTAKMSDDKMGMDPQGMTGMASDKMAGDKMADGMMADGKMADGKMLGK